MGWFVSPARLRRVSVVLLGVLAFVTVLWTSSIGLVLPARLQSFRTAVYYNSLIGASWNRSVYYGNVTPVDVNFDVDFLNEIVDRAKDEDVQRGQLLSLDHVRYIIHAKFIWICPNQYGFITIFFFFISHHYHYYCYYRYYLSNTTYISIIITVTISITFPLQFILLLLLLLPLVFLFHCFIHYCCFKFYHNHYYIDY